MRRGTRHDPARRGPRRRLAAAVLALLAAAPAWAAPKAGPEPSRGPLAARIDAAIRNGGLRGARVGVLVVDLATGEALYARDPDEPLVPASVTKLVTSAAALHLLRPEYRFRTVLLGAGRVSGGTLHGDLWLKAWGDPMLVEERVRQLVSELRGRGIRRVEGALRVDDGYFDRERFGAGWGPVTRAAYYAPHGAVSVNFNTLPTRGRAIAIAGDPAEHAGRFVLEMMRDQGIAVAGGLGAPGPAPESAAELVGSDSVPLMDIVAPLNKQSSNFIAEQLLKTLAAEEEGAPGTADKGRRVLGRYLAGIGADPGGFELHDGSGLSRSNRLSARTVVRLLEAMGRDFIVGPEFISSLKVAGVDGRGSRFRDPLCLRRMRVKTGHLLGVATLAGYAETHGGRRLAFAILANDYRRGRRAADRGIEEVCEAFLAMDGADLVAGSAQRLPPAAEAVLEPPVLGPDELPGDEDPVEEGD